MISCNFCGTLLVNLTIFKNLFDIFFLFCELCSWLSFIFLLVWLSFSYWFIGALYMLRRLAFCCIAFTHFSQCVIFVFLLFNNIFLTCRIIKTFRCLNLLVFHLMASGFCVRLKKTCFCCFYTLAFYVQIFYSLEIYFHINWELGIQLDLALVFQVSNQ